MKNVCAVCQVINGAQIMVGPFAEREGFVVFGILGNLLGNHVDIMPTL
jgi:hypothetical protein